MTQQPALPITKVATAVLIAYLAWFLVPLLFLDIDPNASAASGFDLIFGEGVNEIVVAIVLVALAGILKCWKLLGLKKSDQGGLKFIWLPVAYTMLLVLVAMSMMNSKSLPLGDVFEFHELSLLFLISCLVGFNEEVIFRGFVFSGLLTKLNPLLTVTLCGVIFGLFHFVNLISGQAFEVTLSQVLQAGSMGFMYAALRLRLGSIWPLILLHGLWDFSVTIMQQSMQVTGMDTTATGGFHPFVGMPVLIYGVFVYWRWKVWKSAN